MIANIVIKNGFNGACSIGGHTKGKFSHSDEEVTNHTSPQMDGFDNKTSAARIHGFFKYTTTGIHKNLDGGDTVNNNMKLKINLIFEVT